MNRSVTELKSASGAVDSRAANTRLTGSWLIFVRTVWLALVIPSVGLFVVSLPAYYQQLQRGCVDTLTCSVAGALPPQALHSLSLIGLSASGYAALLTVFFVIIEAIWYGVGIMIFWRRSDDWLALLAAFFLILFNGGLALPSPILTLPYSLVSFLGDASIVVFFLLFPNGRLVPRWMGLILLLDIMNALLNDLPSKGAPFNQNWPGWLYLLVNLIIYGAIIYSQIYRYRRVSTPVQRQQTKWIVLGVTVAAVSFLSLLLIGALIPSLDNNFLFNEVWSIIIPIALLPIPLSIGFSILRYRLYDIDLLINRTLVYSALTVLLALVYFSLIFALQYLLRGIISQNNDVAIVVSTLAIAALFQPLRHRIQAIIDRRFYRRKYDATKVVEAFSATLRSEVDLSQLREHLLTVVQETMHPAHVSLWLREPASKPQRPDHMQP
ncbi:MAG: hypothetical protein ACXWPS_11890 [Ktedonobacteraceae bacterium]